MISIKGLLPSEHYDQIRRFPANFYVNVHTAEYPNGAIRGQIYNVPG